MKIGPAFYAQLLHHPKSGIKQKHGDDHLPEMVLNGKIQFVILTAQLDIALAVTEKNKNDKKSV